ncbi:MAG TPA: ABC transporter permease [Terriglobales bacterium]|nr:ABC transporter permease [Terriglobales bacterium]
MEAVLRELRLAVRQLRRRRGVAVVGVGTLALALGASTAMFSVYRGLVLHPLAFPQPQGLVWMAPVLLPSEVTEAGGFSAPDFLDYRAQSKQFQFLAGYFPNVATLVGRGSPQHVAYANVSGDFFAALGVKAALGRTVERGDEAPTLPEVAVLSAGLWRQRFGGDAQVLGRTLDLDNRELTIVGVMPAGFDYPPGAELWTPEPFSNPTMNSRVSRFLQVVGRLRGGATLAGAQQEASAVAARLAGEYPGADRNQGVRLRRLSDHVAGPAKATLGMMMLAAILVMGIACANVANMLLAGAVGRWQEMALRASLGASRRRLAGQLLTEGLVLAGLGGGLGWGLAAGLMPVVRRLRPAGLPQLSGVRLDGGVLVFTVAATVATALWFGLAPAWELLRAKPGRSLLRAANASPQGAVSRISAGVVMAEVAATVVLVVGAGLLLQSLRRLQRADPGFRPGHVLSFRSALLYNSLAEFYAQTPFFRRLDERLQELPGVEAAGMVSELPFTEPQTQLRFYVAGASGAEGPEGTRPQAGLRRVLPGYFRAMQIPVRGRTFNEDDTMQTPRVVIVSQSLAERLFPGGDALQHALVWGAPKKITSQIVGIAGDVPEGALGGAPGADLYAPYLQTPSGEMTAVVRTRGDPLALLPEVRRVVRELNPEIPVYQVALLDQQVEATTAPDRLRAGLLAAMAGLGLLLAVVGVYGVLSHQVAQRRRDIGIRMALGASAGQVQWMVVGQSLRLIAGGMGAGLLLAWWMSRGLERYLYRANGNDPWTWTAVPLLLAGVGLAASYWPARQAARVDPVITLRGE